MDYVLGYFGRRGFSARKAYLSYVEAGLNQGLRDDLTGGGLIRSLGGWSEIKSLQLKGQDHIMSDKRIQGESDFVSSVLSEANERYERRYELKRRGYDLERIAERVTEIYGMEKHEVFSKDRQQGRGKARSLLAYWAVGEPGMSHTDLAQQLQMSVPGLDLPCKGVESIVRNNKYELIE